MCNEEKRSAFSRSYLFHDESKMVENNDDNDLEKKQKIRFVRISTFSDAGHLTTRMIDSGVDR